MRYGMVSHMHKFLTCAALKHAPIWAVNLASSGAQPVAPASPQQWRWAAWLAAASSRLAAAPEALPPWRRVWLTQRLRRLRQVSQAAPVAGPSECRRERQVASAAAVAAAVAAWLLSRH